jgi:hypothetical protein
MIKRLIAIGFIFSCTSIAWAILAGVTNQRTRDADVGARGRVEKIWGASQRQRPPQINLVRDENETVVVTDDKGDETRKTRRKRKLLPVALSGSDLHATLSLAHRQKGLLWYATYGVRFEGSYRFDNPTAERQIVEISLPFPAERAIFDDLQFVVDGLRWHSQPVAQSGRISGTVELASRQSVTLRVGYRSQGLSRWSYDFGDGVAEVRDFRLAVTTDFRDVDFPEDGVSPTARTATAEGWHLIWTFRRLVSGVNIAVLMPEKLQPGPLASQIASFAPISLFFFIVVLLAVGMVRRIDIHPMYFFFLAAAFFSFHLLFAYLADLVSIHVAFGTAAATSLFLTISYLRVAIGGRFAFLAAGTAQLLYLVSFSYAFFFKGLTGLAVTVGAILTLLVLMQLTARVDWREVFSGPSGGVRNRRVAD